MPRPARITPIDAILRDTAERVVSRISAVIARQVGDLVQERLQQELGSSSARRRGTARRGRGDITRWVADARARRVPNFVIQATGLDTKKKIVAKYGHGAAFQKGRNLPRAKA